MIEFPAEDYVISDGIRKDDWLLLDVGELTDDFDFAGVIWDFAQDYSKKSTFARSHLASDAVELARVEPEVEILERSNSELVLPVAVEVLEHDISIMLDLQINSFKSLPYAVKLHK